MQKTITCVLGNQTYETMKINGKELLVIHGEAVGTSFAIVPGWYSGNERYEKGQLAAIDVELIDPMEQMNIEREVKSRLSAGGKGDPRISFWGSRGIEEEVQPGESESAPTTILVVDDDPTIRDIIKKYLEKEGFEVKTASGSKEAETLLRTSRLPNLMLLDIMMPGGTGWQLLKELEKDPGISSRLPVVAISGLERPADRMEEYDSKMLYDYLVKPFSLAELSRVVRKFRTE